MELYQAVLLGIIQGLTEFLPISSSGHLVILEHLFNIQTNELFFYVSLHLGTLFAVIIIFRKEISNLIQSFFYQLIYIFNKNSEVLKKVNHTDIKFIILIITGSIPTSLIGLYFNKMADRLFNSIFLVGVMLIVTGTIVALSYKFKNIEKEKKENFTIAKAVIIGIVQGIAVIPGISRSGSTIVIGLYLGLNRETAGKFSFLLSVPAIFGAVLLCMKNIALNAIVIDSHIITGTVCSFIFGYCVLKILLYIIKKGQLYLFAPYCWLIGTLLLLYG